MALNLSTLTSSATSGDVLAEALTTADFLEPVPVLRNLARGSQKGGDAKQDVALNQPRSLPLIKNPQGNLGGYLYIPDVAGNYAEGPSVTIGANQTWEAEVEMVITQWGNYVLPMGGGDWTSGFGLIFYAAGAVRMFSKGTGAASSAPSGVTFGTPFSAKYGYDGTDLYIDIDGVRKFTTTAPSQSGSITHTLELNQQANIGNVGNYTIQKAKLTVNSSVVFDCDFNGSTSIRHGDTKFQASVGGPVVLNQSGNDPATVIKKSVLRFANTGSTNISLSGLFNQTITDGYMFAAFSVLGDGGEVAGRIFGINSTGANDVATSGAIFSGQYGTTGDFQIYYGGARLQNLDLFDDANGDILHESLIKNGNQVSRVNNADEVTALLATTISSEEFNFGGDANGEYNAAIDLEFLALFPASITDAQADDVRKYINNRNNVFLRHDTDGYYFFDGAATTDGQVFSGSSSWLGRIVGSDNDDPFKYLSNGSINDRPTTDGYKITFADNSDHFLFNTPLSNGLAGWQVVGTSLGTFAYRVDNDAVTELNLLGNYGFSARQIGQLYGVMLLPDSATGADIEQSRRLLIDRGAADAASVTSVQDFWRNRYDILEFKHVNFTNVTNFLRAWRDADSINNFGAINAPNGNSFTSAWQGTTALTSFPAGAKLGTAATGSVSFSNAWTSSGLTSFSTPLPTATTLTSTWQQCTSLTSFSTELPTATRVDYAWWGDNSLSDFRTTDIKNSTNFSNAWHSCSSLTSFPADAKLGTSANNVNFQSAWRNSGLTSFSTPLPTGNNLIQAWYSCTSLESFSSEITAGNLSYAWYNNTALSEFKTTDIKSCSNFSNAWQNCSSLQSFPADAKLGTEANNVNFSEAWRSSGLTSFSTPLPSAGNCRFSWFGSNLTSFNLETLTATEFRSTWRETNLSSFSTTLPNSISFNGCWIDCSSLTDFGAGVFSAWNPSSIADTVFHNTWQGCTSLTAQSVENILVSIDASGKYGTSTGASGGSALADAGIDIDYNVSTGSLSAATNAAIDSLSGKGWEVYINGVLVIPNILDLEPAAAYSLRSFDADADPNVVKVRRSSDGALSDFKASEVSDGTLTDWVNAEYNKYTSDFSSGVDGWVGTNVSWSNSFDPLDANNYVLRITAAAPTSCRVHLNTPTLNIGQSYNITAEIYIPSTNNEVDGVLLLDGYNVDGIFGDGEALPTNQWVTVTASGVCETNQLRIQLDNNNDDLNGILTSNAIGDIVYVKNVQVVQLTADGHVTTWYDQREIVETGSAYGTTISGTADGSPTTYNQLAPAVAGEFYRVRFTVSNLDPRGRVRYRNYAGSADVVATAGLGSLIYFHANGDYEAYVPSDDGLSLWFYPDSGAGGSFDYSGVSVQQVAEVPNDASQPLVSNMPKLVDAGTLVTEGGLPAMDFGLESDSLSLDVSGSCDVASIFTVTKPNTSSGNPLLGVSGAEYIDVEADSLAYRVTSFDALPFANDFTQQLAVLIREDGAGTQPVHGYRNGVVSTEDPCDTNQELLTGNVSIGRRATSDYYDGTIQEIVILNTDQSANRTGIENNINDTYTIY